MPRDRRSASVVLLLAVALAGLGSWFLLFEDEPQREGPAEAQGEPGTQKPGEPRLLGATGSRAETAEAPEARPATGPPGGDLADPPRQAPKYRIEVVRVLDATGQPIRRAQVTVQVNTGSETQRVSAYTQRDGRASLRLPAGQVIKVTVAWSNQVLLARKDERGIDLDRIGDVRSEDLYVLNVRTVDATGIPRPGQRVLYRPREEGKEPTGWWGDTSDEQGWCHLGPYALGTRLELRAGPRGLDVEEIPDPTAWQEVRVEGTDVEVIVDEVPRLRLAFPGAAPDARLQVTVLNMDTGKPVFPTAQHVVKEGFWTAEALMESVRLEILVFDARRGFFARLHDVAPTGRPIDVHLERGVQISGRVSLVGRTEIQEGGVIVTGRGFEASTHVDARGRFGFTGLPDETFSLDARVLAGVEPGKRYVGRVVRTNERDVRIPVGRSVAVTARLVIQDVAPPPSWVSSFSVAATSPDWPGTRTLTVYGLGRFRLEIPEGRWRLTARGPSTEGTALQGVTELGYVGENRSDVVIHLRNEDR